VGNFYHRSWMRVLAISGSLRAESSSTTLLRALALAAPSEAEVVLFEDLELIPPFNPDRENTIDSHALVRFKQSLRAADAVVFSTPEYAHGVPGVLKNALDWVVGTGELSGKPVALVNASARGVHAQASLREVLRTMDGRLISEAEITIDLVGKKLTAEAIAADPFYSEQLRTALERLSETIQGYNKSLANHSQ
jgi:chromate reductase